MIWQGFKDTILYAAFALFFMAAGFTLAWTVLPAFGGGQ